MTTSPDTSSVRRRPTWDETWLAAAIIFGDRSLCDRSRVGCVIVDASNRMVASGYNGPPAGFVHAGAGCRTWCARSQKDNGYRAPEVVDQLLALDYSDCPALHAEANALSVGDRRHREGGTLYVNSHVCFNCAKLIANSGVSRVVVAAREEAPWRMPGTSYVFLRACGLSVEVRP